MLSFRLFQSYRILRNHVRATEPDDTYQRVSEPPLSPRGTNDIEMTTFRIYHTFDGDDYEQCKIATPNTIGNDYRGHDQDKNESEQAPGKAVLEDHCNHELSPCHLHIALHGCHLDNGLHDCNQNVAIPKCQYNKESFDCNQNHEFPDSRCGKVLSDCNCEELLCCHGKKASLERSYNELQRCQINEELLGTRSDKRKSDWIYKQLCRECTSNMKLSEFYSNCHDNQEILDRQWKIMLDVY